MISTTSAVIASVIMIISSSSIISSGSLVGLVVSKSHACYLLGGADWDWVRIPLGSNFSGSPGDVSGHA